MTSGSAPAPVLAVSSAASTTADSGSLSTDATAAPMPTATAGVIEYPGSWAAIRPPAAPRNRAGNVGPPRKPPSEMPHATPLKTISRASADSDQVAAPETSPGRASWPEYRTSLTLLPVVSAKAIARPETARPATGSSRNGRVVTMWTTIRASRKMAKLTIATAAPSGMVQPKSAMSGRANEGSARGPSANALVLSPVHDPMPIELSEPMPAASSPGMSASGSVGPPRPAASTRVSEAMDAESKMSAIDANIPADATTTPT